jgi:hypothetical protein
MKKVFLFLIVLSFNFQAQSQEEKLPNNEIKINVIYLIVGIPEIGYERILNNNSSVGADFLFSIVKEYNFKFAFTPHYRYYLGEKRAAGFFVEGFGMVNTISSDYYYDDYPNGNYEDEENNTDFALGVSVGGKFITKNKGFIFEVYGGIGRNLINSNSTVIVPRFGLTFGKRF